MREKYIDEKVGVWFIFGSSSEGLVDINNGTEDIFTKLPKETAEKLVSAQEKFRLDLYNILGENETLTNSESC